MNPTQLTNLIVQGNNGMAYCIQYRDQDHPIIQPDHVSNDTKQDQSHKKKSLQINIFAKACPTLNQDVLFGSDQFTTKKKLNPRREILSSHFKYKGPCQAALTDAASVSKASSKVSNFDLYKIFHVIMVVILNSTLTILYIFHPHETS